MKGHLVVYSTKILLYHNYSRQNKNDSKCNRDSRTKPKRNNILIPLYHNGNILKVNLLFQINYGDAFELV